MPTPNPYQPPSETTAPESAKADDISLVTVNPVDTFVEAIQISMFGTGAFATLVSLFFEASQASVGAAIIFLSCGIAVSYIRRRFALKSK